MNPFPILTPRSLPYFQEQPMSDVSTARFFSNEEKLRHIQDGLTSYSTTPQAQSDGYSPQDIQRALEALDRRPLLRWYVLRRVESEMRAEGINWEAIGDFIVKIAPIILEILMRFL